MRTFTTIVASVTAVMASAAPAQSPDAQADVETGKINNQYICVFKDSVGSANVRGEAGQAAGPLGQLLAVYEHSIRGFAVRLPADHANAAAHMAQLKRNSASIAYCEQDQVVRAFADDGDPETPWGIERVNGYRSMAGSSKRAYVIDSGIDLDHSDLVVDRTKGFNCVNSRSGMDDENGHGTHVAGTIAARDNNSGVVGVAADLPVVPVRVLDRRGSGSWSCVIAGIDHVGKTASAGDVANMSLGGGYSKAVNDAVIAASSKGVWFVLAAGNNGANASNYSPASANGAYIRTISASDSADRMPSWSNYGGPVDKAEPGVSINSTYKGGGYKVLSGTSMAAPHHAGLLAIDGAVTDCGAVTGDREAPADQIGCQ